MSEVDVLRKFGLEDHEIQVYLGLLDYGESSASEISKNTGLGRVNIYQICERLIHKGFVSYVIKENVRYFLAADPDIFMSVVRDTERDMRLVLPLLKDRMQKKDDFETKVEIFRGKEGINTILRMILKDEKDYYMLGGGEQCCSKEFELIMEIFVKQAEKLKLKGKLLERKNAVFFVGQHEEYKFLGKEFFASTTTTMWGDKFATFVWTKPYYVILVQNEEVANSNIAFFKGLWKSAISPSLKDRNERILKET